MIPFLCMQMILWFCSGKWYLSVSYGKGVTKTHHFYLFFSDQKINLQLHSSNYMRPPSGFLFQWSKINWILGAQNVNNAVWAHFINGSSRRCWAINLKLQHTCISVYIRISSPYLNNIRKADIHSLHIDSRQPAAVCVKCIWSEYKRQGKRRGVVVRVWVLYHHPSVRRGWLLM